MRTGFGVAVWAVCAVAVGAGPPAGNFEWKSDAPARQGLSAERLDGLKDRLAKLQTKAFVVVRRDRIVYEWYADGFSASQTHYTASMAKALVGGVSAAVAMTDGLLKLDEPAATYVPQWRGNPQKSRITIRQLGSHTSGIEDAEQGELAHEDLTGWKGDFWKKLPPPRDPFTVSRDVAPLLFKPGTDFQYSNPGIAMLGYVVTAAIANGPQKDLRSLLAERVMGPIGAAKGEWAVGYNKTISVDGLPLVGTWGGGNYTPRTALRVGRLMLRRGNWEGRQLISAAAVAATTCDAGTPGRCGIGWWTNGEGYYKSMPRDAFWASGAGHQILLVVPSLELIAIRNGAELPRGSYDSALEGQLFSPLMDAVVEKGQGKG